MLLLDIDVISELPKAGNGKANTNVTAWLSRIDAGNFYRATWPTSRLQAFRC